MQLVDVLAEQTLRLRVSVVDDAEHQLVDLGGGRLGIILHSAVISAEEHAAVIGAVVDAAKLLGHAVLGDHRSGGLGRLLDIVGRACGDIVENQRLGDTSAETDDDILEHLLAGVIGLILGGQGHGIAARHTARNNRDLVNGILRLELVEEDRVTCLVIGGELLFLVAHDLALLLGANDDLDGRLLDLLHGDCLLVGSRREERRLVEQVLQIRARKARGGLCDGAQLDVGCERLLSGVNLEDRLSAVDVGIADDDLTVKSARTEQCGVEDVGTVGRRDQDDAFVDAEAVHFDEQLVERLLTLVVAAAETCASLSADGVDLVDKDDAGRVLLRLIEQVADTRCTDADEHFYKVGA